MKLDCRLAGYMKIACSRMETVLVVARRSVLAVGSYEDERHGGLR